MLRLLIQFLSSRPDLIPVDLLNTQDQTSNRISFSIIIAALILWSAMVINSEILPTLFGVSLIGIAGFLAAAVMGIWLLVAIIQKGRL